jgi:hypothetical protein
MGDYGMPECYRCGKGIGKVIFCPFCGAKQRSGLEMYKAKDKKQERMRDKALKELGILAEKQTDKILLDDHDLSLHATGADDEVPRPPSGGDLISEQTEKDDKKQESVTLPLPVKTAAGPVPEIDKITEPVKAKLVIGKEHILWLIMLALLLIFGYVIYIILSDLKSWLT